MEYKHKFKTKTRETIVVYNYGNIHLRMIDLIGNVNTLTGFYMSWAPVLGHNLLSTIALARKCVKVCLEKAGQLSKIIIDKKIFRLADIIKTQYVIQLVETSKPVIVTLVIAPIIKT